jgi:hypothetical protein
VKFSVRQILASAAGAVIAAIIASIFGVKGTIIGVAIGSAVATLGTALVAQSIERGQEAVKQVVVRAPESSTLLRKLGATGTGGEAASSVDASSAPTEAGPTAGAGAETVEMESTEAPVGATERLEISATADAPRTEHLDATTTPMRPARGSSRRFSWPAIAGTAAIVFVLALMFITAVELISGKPLASIFGNAGTGTSLTNTPPPVTTTTTSTSSTTSTTTNTSSTTTTSTPANTTTSTTAPTGSSTTTTSPGASTTTTTGVGATTTTAVTSP